MARYWTILHFLVSILITGCACVKRLEVQPIGIENEVLAQDILVTNNYNNELVLYWVDAATTTEDGKKTVEMNTIPPRSSVNVSTYVNHIFFGQLTFGKKIQRAAPLQIIVLPGVFAYQFGPVNKNRKKRHPAITAINEKNTKLRVKMKNYAPNIDVYFEDPKGHQLITDGMKYGMEDYLNGPIGGKFVFTAHGKENIMMSATLHRNMSLIVVTDPHHPPPEEVEEYIQKYNAFLDAYLQHTGIPYVNHFSERGPRPAPQFYMWPAKSVGDTYTVYGREPYWFCQGIAYYCQEKESVKMELEVVSTQPKIFIADGFLSEFEVQEVKRLAAPFLQQSIVGFTKGEQSKSSLTRTSRTAWLPRFTSPVIESLFLRAADLLQINEGYLHHHTYAEDLQVVHYREGEKYDAHYDWSDNGYDETRFITLLLYLTDKTEGGETAFPKANNLNGLKIHPGKGKAVLFYNMLEDGNGDDLAYHAALPVEDGEKWLANFWVWDPKFH